MMRARQQGQALSEFLVIALVLIPLFLLLPMIGKYQDISHSAQLASRYAAFDAMQRNAGSKEGWKPPQQLADEVRRRFFSNSDAPVKTNDTAGDFTAHRNAFWRDSQGQPLIRNFGQDVTLTFGKAAASSTPDGGFSSASDTGLFGVAGEAMDLPTHGLYTANITVRLANPAALAGSYSRAYETFGALNLSMTRHTSLVLGAWGARGPEQVRDRIDKPLLFPGGLLAPARPLVNAAVVIVESPSCLSGGCTKGPELGKLEFWDDVVPKDRLK